jgi:hypothetical protein
MTDNAPMQGDPPRPARPNPNPLTDPANAPLGTIVVFPRWQDEHHATGIAIRWAPPYDMDEQRPWLILGSDGPQKLDHDAVEGCQVLDIPANEACWYASKPRRWVIGVDVTDADFVDAIKRAPMGITIQPSTDAPRL